MLAALPEGVIHGVRVTGTGARILGEQLGVPFENEFKAITRAVAALHPDVTTVFEMGGETSKFIQLDVDPEADRAGIVDYQTNGDCAAGTGSFMDQQANRLLYQIEDVGDIVLGAGKAATIAGRCSVFAKSDMIHAQQKGYQPPEVLKGLCDAVIRNYRGTITKGKTIQGTVAFIGGVAANMGAVTAMRDEFGLAEEQIVIPSHYAWMGAIGAALIEAEQGFTAPVRLDPGRLASTHNASFPTSDKLSLDKVMLLRDRVKPYVFPATGTIDAYLGIDVGSVSTNLVVLDAAGEVVKEIYLKTDGRPVEVVNKGLAEIWDEMGPRLDIKGVGTTGSGRELIGELIGADTVNDEITAHKTGATFIGRKLIDRVPDTIFEIGGQDSKYISLQDGVVVDFAMNEACAAGTGSFLEEQAEKLGIKIIGEFAELALSSDAPIRLGERCTVFMERDVNSYLQRGASQADLVAGLAYSIATNYLNRLVGGRTIGDTIYFQGGTAYNDSVAAAFSMILDKEIIVPPHNGVVGAIGMALLAREKMAATQAPSKFRGWDLEQVDYTIREFTCKGCTNECDIRQFTIGDEKTYWGDKCSDRYRKRAKVDKKPIIQDLPALRERLLFSYVSDAIPTYHTGGAGVTEAGDHTGAAVDLSGPVRSGTGSRLGTVGIPRAMYTYDRLPFWATFFREVGLRRAGLGRDRQAHPRGGHRPLGGRALLPHPGGARPRGRPARPGRRLRLHPQPAERRDRPPRARVARLPLGPDAALRHRGGAALRGRGRQDPGPHAALPARAGVRQGGPARIWSRRWGSRPEVADRAVDLAYEAKEPSGPPCCRRAPTPWPPSRSTRRWASSSSAGRTTCTTRA